VKPAKNTILLWYDNDAEDAATYYAETFPESSAGASHRAPGDYPVGKQGDVLMVEFTVMGIPCTGLNGGPELQHNEAFSFQVSTADQAETDRHWNAIVGNGGNVATRPSIIGDKRGMTEKCRLMTVDSLPKVIGYACVSAEDLLGPGQVDALKWAGVTELVVERASDPLASILQSGRRDKSNLLGTARGRLQQFRPLVPCVIDGLPHRPTVRLSVSKVRRQRSPLSLPFDTSVDETDDGCLRLIVSRKTINRKRWRRHFASSAAVLSKNSTQLADRKVGKHEQCGTRPCCIRPWFLSLARSGPTCVRHADASNSGWPFGRCDRE
jgi:predicted 3-demethylubiquinone-9 3-methyltransferase (glyoxalase superfamily)